MTRIQYLIERIGADNVLSLSVHPLITIPKTHPAWFEMRLAHHNNPICLAVKKSRANHERCVQYKTAKVARALTADGPCFDICPFGVLDHIVPVKPPNPSFVLFISYARAVIGTPRAGVVHQFVDEASLEKNVSLAPYLSQIAHVRSITEAVLFAGMDPLTLPVRESVLEKKVRIARDMVAEYFRLDVSLRKIAQALRMSEALLARYYKKAFGHTLHDDLNRERIAYSKRLLAKGYSITDAAFESGFNDASYFCRMFKRISGKSPRSWKRGY
ncbi:MAG: AraC family transcriptional regulator [Spirochaetota bacterium]